MALLQRLHDFLAGPTRDPAIADLYRACVQQARQVEFYQDLSIPDTVDGRFDMLLLHVFLVMHRLANEGEAKQKLFDLMFADMDRSLREMGVGDMSISRKIKPMISAFYGRGQAYEKALQDQELLQSTLVRNLYNNKDVPPVVLERIAVYVRECKAALEQQPLENILAGKIHFPKPVV